MKQQLEKLKSDMGDRGRGRRPVLRDILFPSLAEVSYPTLQPEEPLLELWLRTVSEKRAVSPWVFKPGIYLSPHLERTSFSSFSLKHRLLKKRVDSFFYLAPQNKLQPTLCSLFTHSLLIPLLIPFHVKWYFSVHLSPLLNFELLEDRFMSDLYVSLVSSVTLGT